MNHVWKIIFFGFLWGFATQVALAQDINALLTQLSQTGEANQKMLLLNQIGLHYQKQEAYAKANQYFTESYKLAQNQGDEQRQLAALQNIAWGELQQRNYPVAKQAYEEILELQKRRNISTVNTLDRLVDIYTQMGDWENALKYEQAVFELQRQSNDLIGIGRAYNNLGYLHEQKNDFKSAVKSYNQSIQIARNLDKFVKDEDRVVYYINAGVAHTRSGDFKNARKTLEDALKLAQKNNNIRKEAEIHNFIAASEFTGGNYSAAVVAARSAIELAEPLNAQDILMSSYRILAGIAEKEGDFQEAQKYNQLAQSIKEQIEKQEKQRQQNILENQIDIEKKENEIKTLLADKEKQAAALRESQLEKQQRETELVLKARELEVLKSNQERQAIELKNQALAIAQANQLAQITRQQAENERQQAENDRAKQKLLALEQERTIKDLALKQKEAQEKERQKAIELLEKDKKLQDEQLKAGKLIQQFGLVVIGLGTAVFALILISFIRSQRARKRLHKQNIEIEAQRQEILTQNEELYQNQEEIMAQRDFIEHKNKELAETNEKIQNNEAVLRKAYDKLKESETQIIKQKEEIQQSHIQIQNSIKSALTIQQSILPYKSEMDNLLKDYFVIYRPKDVVSGDFYWLYQASGTGFLAAIDCTGHSVPGAFMSLIGNHLLDKIIIEWNILDPKEILHNLHFEVQKALRQQETGNNSGMDMTIIRMERTDDDKTKIYFCGAKNSLLYIPIENGQLEVLHGDRRSIGGIQNEDTLFTTREVLLSKGSLLYMGSDGFEDQNDIRRKKFGAKRLFQILQESATLSTSQQKVSLETALDTHMAGTEQRDDILLIGVRV
jgi:serine phosphatase RsbU (regulator of sigma subunit)/tetratricopeptide (TPR) repeat protein